MSIDSKKTSKPTPKSADKDVNKARAKRQAQDEAMAATATGLTGRAVLLPTDDMDEYVRHLSRHHAEYLPQNDVESELVQTIADCEWRLRRIPNLEYSIYAMGQQHFADEFPDESPEVRRALIQARTYIDFERQLLQIFKHENRLRREREKAIAALKLLKKHRPKRASAAASRSTSTFDGPSEYPFSFEYQAAPRSSESASSSRPAPTNPQRYFL